MTSIVGVHENGQRLELEATFGTHEEDGRLLCTGIVRDVTAREKLQAQLRASEERYALAAKAANDGLWDWDLSDRRNLLFVALETDARYFRRGALRQPRGLVFTDPRR